MSAVDLLVLAVVAALLALAIRSVVRSRKNGCSSCGSREGCSAHATGAPCPAARDMLRNVGKSLDK